MQNDIVGSNIEDKIFLLVRKPMLKIMQISDIFVFHLREDAK